MRYILSFILLMSASGLLGQSTLRPRGDVNCDWKANIDDVTELIVMMLSGEEYHAFYTYAADINDDKAINIEDVTALIVRTSSARKSTCAPSGGLMRWALMDINPSGRQISHEACRSRAVATPHGPIWIKNPSDSSWLRNSRCWGCRLTSTGHCRPRLSIGWDRFPMLCPLK